MVMIIPITYKEDKPKKERTSKPKEEKQIKDGEFNIGEKQDIQTLCIAHLSQYKKAAERNPNGKTAIEYKRIEKLLKKIQEILG